MRVRAAALACDLEDDPVWTAMQSAPRLAEDDLSPEQWTAWDEEIAACKARRAELVVGDGVEVTIERMGGRDDLGASSRGGRPARQPRLL